MKQHQLQLSSMRYPGGLRIIECAACSYSLAAEVNRTGMVQMETAVFLDHGDATATHTFFQAPDEPPTLSFGGELGE